MKKRLWFTGILLLALALAFCAQADGMDPYFTVNGSESGASVPFNGKPVFRVCAPGATAVRLLASQMNPVDDPQSWDRYFDRGKVTAILEENGMTMFDAGAWLVTAAYTTDDYPNGTDLAQADITWIPIGSGVTVEVADWIARLDAPSAALSAQTVTRGDTLTVTVTSFQQKNEWYWLDIEKKTGQDDWQWLEHVDMDVSENVSNAFTLSTLPLSPGEYRLWVRCEAEGYEDNCTVLPFTVTANAGALPDVSLQLSAASMQTSQDLTIYAWAPGADFMAVEISWDEDPNWRDFRYGDYGGEDAYTFKWGCSQSGEYTFTLRAWFGDEEIDSESVILSVDAPNGDLCDPVLQNVPGVMPAGTSISGSFAENENNADYQIELYYFPEGGGQERLFTLQKRADETDLSIPGVLFERTGLYRLQIHASRTGWNGGHTDHQIMVVEELDQSLTLTVNGGTSDVTGYVSMRGFFVDVAFPDSVTALRILNGDRWEYFDIPDFHGETWRMTSGDYTLLALATDAEPVWRQDGFDWDSFNWDDLYWGMISNTVRLNVTAPNGRLDAPSLTVPQTVVRGEWLQAVIGGAENAEWYHLRVIHLEDGHEDGCLFDEMYYAAGSILIPTDRMEAGENYAVQLWAEAVGYDSAAAQEKSFTVTQSTAAEHFLVSSQSLLTEETLFYSISSPGAERVRITCGTDWWDEAEGSVLDGRRTFDRPGDYELKAIVPDGEGWRLVGEPIVVHVSAPNGKLEITIDGPSSVPSDGDAQFTVTWHHNGLRYYRGIFLNPPDWEGAPLETVSITEEENTTVGVFCVHGAALTADTNYYIESELRPEAPGYLATNLRAEFIVLNAQQRGTVTVSSTELQRCEEARVTVDVPGATALWVYHGDDNWDGFVGSHAEESWSFFQVGDNQVFARYTTEEIADPDHVNYEQINWTGVTPIVTVHVSSAGTLSAPSFTLENEIVSRGQPFRITINTQQNLGEWYIASLQDMNYQNVTDNFFWDDYNRCIKVETSGVPSDLYYLCLHGDAVGYESCDVHVLVAVEEADEGVTISLPQSPMRTMDRFTVTAYAPQAETITLVITRPTGEVLTEIERNGEAFTYDFSFMGDGTFHAVFTAAYADGSTKEAQGIIEIIAPYGTSPAAELHMTSVWQEGEDLCFLADGKNADFISVDVQDAVTQEYVYEDSWLNFGDWHYSIPAGSFTPGRRYTVTVYSQAVGYLHNETTFTIGLLPASPSVLSLPAVLSEIEEEAFSGTAVQKLVIPASVASIASGAFDNCPDLLVVAIENDGVGISPSAFSAPFTVYGTPGSAAESFAASCPLATFVYLDD